MKQLFFLWSFTMFTSIELNAQQDSPETAGKDSLNTVISDLKIDTAYYPPCILPLEPDSKLPFFKFNPVRFDSGCNAKGAKRDLKNGKAMVWFPGGFVGRDFSSEADQEFQKRYQVQFVSPGCVRSGDEDPAAYNEIIFKYLDRKYGTGWRNELSSDAIGFEKPIIRTPKLTSPLAMRLANPQAIDSQAPNPETETSVWWYILPTSGFALLVSLYFIKKRKD